MTDGAKANARSRLEVAPMHPIEWQAAYPSCGNQYIIHDGMIEETSAGSFVVAGADSYQRCDDCDTQFEVAEMAVDLVERPCL